jgi:hypothetical protein
MILSTGETIYDHLKSNGEIGYTLSKINDFGKKLKYIRKKEH